LKKEEMTEGKQAGRASKKQGRSLDPPLILKVELRKIKVVLRELSHSSVVRYVRKIAPAGLWCRN